MPCYHPIPAALLHQTHPKTGNPLVSFRLDLPKSSVLRAIKVPCGRCIGCRLERSRQWAVRCVHEAELHEFNCFITLTFDDAHLAADRSLHGEDFQLFMKRLRKHFSDVRIRFFHCGEYGSLNERPHHHAILFGLDFADKVRINTDNLNPLYISPTLEKLWPFGFSTIGSVTFDSAAYVARYVMKKVNGDLAEDHYKGRKPEFVTMSRRPGIAKDWFDKYYTDVYNYDEVILKDRPPCKPPRYYDSLYDIINHDDMERIKALRVEKAAAASDVFIDYDRLAVKEKFKEASYKRYKERKKNVSL